RGRGGIGLYHALVRRVRQVLEPAIARRRCVPDLRRGAGGPQPASGTTVACGDAGSTPRPLALQDAARGDRGLPGLPPRPGRVMARPPRLTRPIAPSIGAPAAFPGPAARAR